MKQRKRNIIVAIGTATVVIIAVVLTVTLVLTLSDDDDESNHAEDYVVVEANQGFLVGNVTPEAGMFFGIPFSQPPVGDYRWRNPREPVDFPGEYWDATYIRPACIQICHQPAEEYSCPVDGEDEDCLYLNVWVPSRLLRRVDGGDIIETGHFVIAEEYQQADDNSLAVMLFLHGGNFIIGAGSATLYDGRYLADHGNVVAVTANYRLGPLGYLVEGDGEDAAVGNYGVWDVVQSLEWVRDNIKWFGGNPNKVTVYGQSAGAEAIGVLMTSPYIKDSGLFHQCIMQSNPYGLPFRDWDNAKEFGGRFTEATGCSRGDMDCLRNVDVDTILQAYQETSGEVVGLEKVFLIFQPWGPVIDGDFLPEQPVDAIMRGAALDIPSIIGGTVDEGMYFVDIAFGEPVGSFVYVGAVVIIAKNESSLVLDEYPPSCPLVSPNCDNRYLMNDVVTDFLFLCPMRASMNAMKSDTWFYIFNETWSFYELWEKPVCFDRVCHAAELPYVFNIANLTTYDFTEAEKLLSNRMGWYWTNFAKYGNPNGEATKNGRLGQITDGEGVDAAYWPTFKNSGTGGLKALQITAEGDFAMDEPYKKQCDFWDQLDSYADH